MIDITEFKKKFRRSKEWKEKREKLIKERGEKCEWCESKDYLTPAHQDFHEKYEDKESGLTFSFVVTDSHLKTNYYKIFQSYLQQILIKKLPKEYFKKFMVCPNCDASGSYVRFRTTKTPPIRCYKCYSEFDSLDETITNQLEKEVWKKLYEDEEIKKILQPVEERVKKLFIEWYENFDICLLLCRKCHFAQSKGMSLCKKCKKNYHRSSFEFCYECNPKKDLIEVKKKIRKINEEIEYLEEGDFDICCNACGVEFCGEDDWEEDEFGGLAYCSKCKNLSNKEELAEKREREADEKLQDSLEQRKELINNLPIELKNRMGFNKEVCFG